MGVPLPLQGVPRRRPPAASVFSLITPRLLPSSLTASTPPIRTWRQLHCAASPIPGNWPPSIRSNHGRCEPSRVWSGPIWRGSSNGRKKDVVIPDEPGHPPPCSGQADSLTCESMLACRRRCAQVCGQACTGLPPACPPATYLAKVRQWRGGWQNWQPRLAADVLPQVAHPQVVGCPGWDGQISCMSRRHLSISSSSKCGLHVGCLGRLCARSFFIKKFLFIPFDVDIQLRMSLIIYYVTYLKSVKSFSKGQT